MVFATETLSLGVNMPARSVVIEKLYKFGGERVEPLTPGEYTQLTGRAGRRGTDEVGYAVVAWSPNVTFEQVASLAGARSYTLTSSFRPTYNMATNLVRRCSPEQAHHLLNLSFAQYRADADVVRLETAPRAGAARAGRGRTGRHVRAGRRVRVPAPGSGRGPGAHAAPGRLGEIVAAMEGVRPGDVLVVTERKPGGLRADDRVAVISKSQRKKGDVSLRAITAGRRLVSLVPRDFHLPPQVVARLPLPAPYDPKSREFQRRVATTLARTLAEPPGEAAEGEDGGGRRRRSRRPALRGPPGGHVPVAERSPEGRRPSRASGRSGRRLEKQVQGRTGSLARQFDKVLQLLERWGYVKGWALTEAGGRLARIYHEQDLLIAECAERGLFDGLTFPEMAGLASVFTYEARGPASVAPVAGSGRPAGPKTAGTPSRPWPANWQPTNRPSVCRSPAPRRRFRRPRLWVGQGQRTGEVIGAPRRRASWPGGVALCR